MNSSIEVVEAAKLAQKLLDRTLEGKLSWEISYEGLLRPINVSGEPDMSATRFSTRLEPNFGARVSRFGSNVAFVLVLDPEAELLVEKKLIDLTVEVDPSYGYDSREEKNLASLLVDLYTVARRSALKIDASVEKALSYLDQIAS
jgi:hypothetical protein